MSDYKEVYLTNKLRNPLVLSGKVFKDRLEDNRLLEIKGSLILGSGETVKLPKRIVEYAMKCSKAVNSLISKGDLVMSERFNGLPVYREELCRTSEYTAPPRDIDRENQMEQSQSSKGRATLVDEKVEVVPITYEAENVTAKKGRPKKDTSNFKTIEQQIDLSKPKA